MLLTMWLARGFACYLGFASALMLSVMLIEGLDDGSAGRVFPFLEVQASGGPLLLHGGDDNVDESSDRINSRCDCPEKFVSII